MSSILKALKKVQQNKKLNSGDSGISSYIPNESQPGRSIVKSSLPIIILSVICSAGTYIILTHFNKPDLQPVATATSPAPKTAVTVPVLTRVSSAVLPFKTVSSSSLVAKSTVQHAITSPKIPVKVKNRLVSAAEYSKHKTPAETTKKQIMKKAVVPVRGESLTVNGLALSDGETRQAVVNGITVAKGSYVGGARVEDIVENRVKFSRGGMKFEITVGSSGP